MIIKGEGDPQGLVVRVVEGEGEGGPSSTLVTLISPFPTLAL